MLNKLLTVVIAILLIGCASYKGKLAKYNGNRIQEDAVFDEGITELSKGLAKAMLDRNLYNVAVIQFISGENSTSAFGRIVSEKIAGKMAQLPNEFSVIERKHLNRLEFLEEQTLRRIDGSIRTVITGTHQELDNSIDISAKLIDVRTGKIHAATTVLIPKTSSLIWALTSDQYLKKIH